MSEKSPREGALPVPATKRMAALRERRRRAGMTPMEVWAHPDDHQAIRDEAARLAKARDAAANDNLPVSQLPDRRAEHAGV